MFWNISYEIAAAIVLIIISLYFFTSKRAVTLPSNVFVAMLILSLIGRAVNMTRAYMYNHLMDFSLFALRTITSAYFIIQVIIFFLMYYYVKLTVVRKYVKRRETNYLFLVPAVASIILLILSVPYELAFTILYHDGIITLWPYLIIYAALAFYTISTAYWIYFCKDKMPIHQRMTFYFSLLSLSVSLILKQILRNVLFFGFGIALTLLLIYFAIEDPKLVTDELTGLFNRAAFIDRLSVYIRRKDPFHVITMAMDDFGFINETYGYYFGDLMLKAIGKKLQETSNTVYRYMGDTFCIIVNDESKIMQTINRIKSKLDAPWNINSTVCLLSASFCVVSFPTNADTVNELLDFIDFTMQEAKKVNKGAITFGKNSSRDKINRNNTIEYLIKQAIQYDQFEMHYQPIYSVKEGRFVAAEALIRLFDDEHGYISPAEFIPLAEKNGSILKIGQITFEKVCRFLKEQQVRQLGIEYVEVNLSIIQCMQRRLSEQMIGIMKAYEIDPSQINFELTETAVAESKGMLETTMNELMGYGCSFSLDDFGTGFSNISYVTQLPFKLVKIDKGLVWAAQGSCRVKTAISHLIAMFKKMDMKIIAEGVETKEQLDMILDMGCDLIQGYYYSKPLSEEDFLALLQNETVKA